MRKINLDVSRLAVESFDTASGSAKARGTVRANQETGTSRERGSCDDCSGLRPCEQSYATDWQVVCPCQGGTTYCVD